MNVHCIALDTPSHYNESMNRLNVGRNIIAIERVGAEHHLRQPFKQKRLVFRIDHKGPSLRFDQGQCHFFFWCCCYCKLESGSGREGAPSGLPEGGKAASFLPHKVPRKPPTQLLRGREPMGRGRAGGGGDQQHSVEAGDGRLAIVLVIVVVGPWLLQVGRIDTSFTGKARQALNFDK